MSIKHSYAATCFTIIRLFIYPNYTIAAVEPTKTPSTGTLRGIFTIENIPTDGIKLALRGSDKQLREAVTNRDGSYRWTGIARGSYWLSVILPGNTNPQKIKIDVPSTEMITLNLVMKSNRSGDPGLTLTLEAP
jgi:hypothetical protein